MAISIGQIKRNLNYQPLPFMAPPIIQPESRKVYAERESPPPTRLVNADFNPVEDEEPPKPNSEIWKPKDSDAPPPPVGSVSRFLKDTDIENEKYDWRLNTKKGKLSHKNFTLYLKDALD